MDPSTKPADTTDSVDSLETPDTVVEPGSSSVQTATGANTPAPLPRSSKFDMQAYLRSLVNKVNIYLLLFVFILLLAGGVLIIAIQSSKNQAKQDETATQKLTEEALKSLEGSDAKVGDPKQLLSIESNAVFSGKVLIRDSLDVAGAIKVGGALSLPGITVSGTSQFDQVQLNSLSISGNASIQGQLTVQKGLSVASNGSFAGTLSAPVISTDKLVLNQDLQLNRHIDAGGATPGVSGGPAIGGGGTVSINGSDTAGTVTVNNGGGAGAGTVATVTFTVKFNGNPHVVITPVCGGPCNLGAYVTNRSATGFSIGVSSNSGGSYSFSYLALE